MGTHSQASRSPQAAAQRERARLNNVATKIAANVQVIKLPLSLEEYGAASVSRDQKTMKKFNKMCDDLMSKASQCVSARFLDRNGMTIFVYLGRRIKTATPPVSDSIQLYY